MAQNTAPIYGLTPNVGRVAITGIITKSDGTATAIGTDIFLAFTAGANGSWISKVRFNPVGTTAATGTAATTLRVYISTATSGATTGGTNTFLVGEVSAAAQTADHSTTATASLELPMNFALNASQTILVSTHVANNANTSWQATVFGTDY